MTYRSTRTLVELTLVLLAALLVLHLVRLAPLGSAGAAVRAVARRGATPLFVAVAASFALWLRRALANLPALGKRDAQRHWPLVAVGLFFVPPLNVFASYAVMADLYRDSQRPPQGAGAGRPILLVWAWWLLLMVWPFFVGAPPEVAIPFTLAAYGSFGLLLWRIERRQEAQWRDRQLRHAVPPPARDRLR